MAAERWINRQQFAIHLHFQQDYKLSSRKINEH
jgi:hypothetical protein